jgi:hypothetical protein
MTKKKLILFGLVSACLLLSLFTFPAFAQQVEGHGRLLNAGTIPNEVAPQTVSSSESPEPLAYGTGWTVYSMGPCDVGSRESTLTYQAPNCVSVQPISDGTCYVGFPLHIPSGASLQYVRLFYYDDTSSSDPAAGLWRADTSGSQSLLLDMTPSAWSGGNRMVQFGPIAETVDNYNYSYNVLAALHQASGDVERIYKIVVYYTLQISPAPGAATFNDVPLGAPFFQEIEALAASGITTGYGDGSFRPNNNVTRAAVAAWLSRALGLHWPF